MTTLERTFPVAPRLLVLAMALLALIASIPLARAESGPSSSDVSAAHQAYTRAEDDIEQYQAEIADIQVKLTAAVTLLDEKEAELEQVKADIAQTRARINEAAIQYEEIRAQLSDRAVQAFMSGGGSNLELLLGATSLADLSDRMEFVDAVAESDASLAQQVANTEAALEFDKQNLQLLEAEQEEKVAAQQEVRDGILADLSRVNELRDLAATEAERTLSTYRQLKTDRAQYLERLAQATTTTSPPSSGAGLPPGFHNPLEVCPVDAPRVFSDGFGAPRYTGGFHLHGGNDLVSNYGTPIRAPFDGIAERSYNTLGGNSEYVRGSAGYVYNAHLDHYSANSDGPVQAGDIIGYVADSGDATGTPHDHFEWHPNTVPTNWPASYYGYTVIGSAVNPYPVLVDVCG